MFVKNENVTNNFRIGRHNICLSQIVSMLVVLNATTLLVSDRTPHKRMVYNFVITKQQGAVASYVI